jgi:hypothetical protein
LRAITRVPPGAHCAVEAVGLTAAVSTGGFDADADAD